MGSITPDLADYVKVADMRKPASDVAGIEEVNAKQDKIGYTPADDSKVVHNSGNEEIGDQKTFDTAPIDKTTGHPYITKDGVPSTLADTTKLANFTGGLQSNGNDAVTTNQVSANIVQTIDPYADLFTIKQAGIYRLVWGNQNTLKNFPSPDGSATIIYSGSGNTDNGIQITVIDSWGSVFVSHWQGAASKPGYSAWQNVSNIANPTQDTNFTAKLQKSGIDVATTSDVSKAVNTAVSPLNINTNWISLSVDSSQIKDTDWDSKVTNCNYRIAHSTLYLTGTYKMLTTSTNKSEILFQLPTNIVSQISFPSTNEFKIGIIQAVSQIPMMVMINLTNDGKIRSEASPYDMNSNYGARFAFGFINASIPLK